jgi:Ni,Fe-hydrogenase I large subunit
MITDVDDGEVESPDKKIDYIEALNDYFKLKSEYEQKLREKRRKEYTKGNDKKDKMRRVSAIKPKCINCHRPVGTIFATDANGYTAICGDKNSPCKLNIRLLRGNFEQHESILTEFKASIDDVKERIIKLKMFTLFNYVSEATSSKQFKKELDEYNTFSAVYKDELHKYNELYNSSHKPDLIRSKSSAIHQIQLTIRKLLDDYEKTENSELLKTAIYTYKTDLMPEIANLSRFKYDIMEMNNNEVESVLFQSEVALSKSEYIYGEHPSVDKYVIN